MGRSGSTLLQQMLNQHPLICSPPESRFILHLMDAYGDITNWTPELKLQFIQDLYTDSKFKMQWNIPAITVKKKLLDAPSQTTFINICNLVRSCFKFNNQEKFPTIFVDKNPMYSLFTSKILSNNHEAKVIHLIRDPRGVINGQINTLKKSNIFFLCQHWVYMNSNIDLVSRNNGVEYIRVFYEDLITSPQKTLKEICLFLGIDYSVKLLEHTSGFGAFYRKQNQPFNTTHQSVQKPLSLEIAEKWKKNLTEDQLLKISNGCHSLANSYGYKFKYKKNTLRLKLGFFLGKFEMHIKYFITRAFFTMPLRIRKFIFALKNKV